MNEPTEAQIREVWEWCGVIPTVCNRLPNVGRLDYPPIDLNNLFEYAVPKLKLMYLCIWEGFEAHLAIHITHERYKVFVGKAETPALALFWAIWEVIHA